MITKREEVIDKAFKVFLRMNYEKASIKARWRKPRGGKDGGSILFSLINSTCLWRYRQVCHIQMQTPANKFAGPTETLAEFIEQYVAGVSAVMNHIIKQVQCCV